MRVLVGGGVGNCLDTERPIAVPSHSHIALPIPNSQTPTEAATPLCTGGRGNKHYKADKYENIPPQITNSNGKYSWTFWPYPRPSSTPRSERGGATPTGVRGLKNHISRHTNNTHTHTNMQNVISHHSFSLL